MAMLAHSVGKHWEMRLFTVSSGNRKSWFEIPLSHHWNWLFSELAKSGFTELKKKKKNEEKKKKKKEKRRKGKGWKERLWFASSSSAWQSLTSDKREWVVDSPRRRPALPKTPIRNANDKTKSTELELSWSRKLKWEETSVQFSSVCCGDSKAKANSELRRGKRKLQLFFPIKRKSKLPRLI